MALRGCNLVTALCVLLCACSDNNATNPQGDAGGGGGASGHGGSGAHAGSGGAGAHGDAGMCEQRQTQASAAVQSAADAADSSCSITADCEIISNSTDCFASCGVLVSKNGKADVQAAIAAQNAGVCAGFTDDGCKVIVPPCVPPGPIGCVAGQCQWLDGQSSDAGSSAPGDGGTEGDAGAIADGCVDRTLVWGLDGGLVAYQDKYTLAPCRTFLLKRTAFRMQGSDASCQNEVATSAAVSADDVDAVLASGDMKAALAAAPVLYGNDTRPVDGTVFRIELGAATVDIGDDCNAQPGCVAIPSGVAAARALLEALTMQQRKLGDCTSVP